MELNIIVDSYMKHGQSFKQRSFRLQGALNTPGSAWPKWISLIWSFKVRITLHRNPCKPGDSHTEQSRLTIKLNQGWVKLLPHSQWVTTAGSTACFIWQFYTRWPPPKVFVSPPPSLHSWMCKSVHYGATEPRPIIKNFKKHYFGPRVMQSYHQRVHQLINSSLFVVDECDL